MSRFMKADDVLILQSFDINGFPQGVPDQPKLLLACIGKSCNEVTKIMKEYENNINTKRAMTEMERQEKKRATMRETGAELNAKRAARATSETWTCKKCNEEKGRIEFSERQWKSRKKDAESLRGRRITHNVTGGIIRRMAQRCAPHAYSSWRDVCDRGA